MARKTLQTEVLKRALGEDGYKKLVEQYDDNKKVLGQFDRQEWLDKQPDPKALGALKDYFDNPDMTNKEIMSKWGFDPSSGLPQKLASDLIRFIYHSRDKFDI